uniref:Orexin receptor 2-like GPCR protein n=1 Tax=Polyphagotarsonemus latus TaxID=1204166 RepID=A0AAN0N6I4_9ACAR
MLSLNNLTTFENQLNQSFLNENNLIKNLTESYQNQTSENILRQISSFTNEIIKDVILNNSTSSLKETKINLNESAQICLNSSSQNNETTECYDKEEYQKILEDYIYPAHYEFVLIALHIIVFFVGLVGNVLVCISVYRNHTMRNVVNYFIVNLAVADFLVILICLPPTVLWDVTETWWLGNSMCKTVLYFQGVSVFVSILTLTFISIDRWYAICHPLRFKCTTAKARIVIAFIWLTSLSIMVPEFIDLHIEPSPFAKQLDKPYFTDCRLSWSDKTQLIYQIIIVSLLFIIPFSLMSIAYYQIAKVLWIKSIPGSAERCSPTKNKKKSLKYCFTQNLNKFIQKSCCNLCSKKKTKKNISCHFNNSLINDEQRNNLYFKIDTSNNITKNFQGLNQKNLNNDRYSAQLKRSSSANINEENNIPQSTKVLSNICNLEQLKFIDDKDSNQTINEKINERTNEEETNKNSNSLPKENFFQSTITKFIQIKLNIQRIFGLKKKLKTNELQLSDNINNKQNLNDNQTDDNFETTNFIQSRRTNVKKDKINRASTPVQLIYTEQNSFKRIRRMTVPGNRLSSFISTNQADSRVNCEGHVQSRRKAAKMLIAVVVMFGFCYLPLHIINTLRYTIGLPQNDITTVASLISHWLCYANSALNPIIYNFMSGKFRREFKNAFACMCFRKKKKSIDLKGTQRQLTTIHNRRNFKNQSRIINKPKQLINYENNKNLVNSNLVTQNLLNENVNDQKLYNQNLIKRNDGTSLDSHSLDDMNFKHQNNQNLKIKNQIIKT